MSLFLFEWHRLRLSAQGRHRFWNGIMRRWRKEGQARQQTTWPLLAAECQLFARKLERILQASKKRIPYCGTVCIRFPDFQ